MNAVPKSITDFSDLDDFDSEPSAPLAPEKTFEEIAIPRVKVSPRFGARDMPRNPARFENCRRCGGSGRYYRYSSLGSKCFKCNGTGNGLSISPEAVKARARAAAKKITAAQELAERVAAFKAANPDIVAFWASANSGFEFASSTRQALEKYGELTENQTAAIRKCIAAQAERDAQRAAERAARVVDVGGAGFTRLLTVFENARNNGLKHPALVFDKVCFKPAKKYPGSLYVTGGRAYESEFYGRVDASGKYDPTRSTPGEIVELVKAIGADPFAEAVAYGKRTGMCCCCGRELTNAESIELGIGPICRAKWGM